jgi:hypothetical protein
MKISEVVSGHLKSYIVSVRCKVDGMGSISANVVIRCDGFTQARYLASRVYGRENVLGIRGAIDESTGVIKPKKPLTPDQQQIQSLETQSKALKQRIKQVKAQQRIRRDQQALAKANQIST